MIASLLVSLALASAASIPTCVAPDGERFHLELAVSDQERAIGLMFRDSLPADHGMLFLFSGDDVHSFWMKNTVIPLDLIWLAADGTVVDVRPNVQPCRLDPCPSYSPSRPARVVLELGGNVAAKHGIKAGTRLRFENVPGFPAPAAR